MNENITKEKKLPESQLIRRTFTIRQMDLPPEIKLTKKSYLRWFALATGLISEKETRTTVLDILDALFYFQFAEDINPTTTDISNYVLKNSSISEKSAEKLIRYHIKRLIDFGILERKKGQYSFIVSPMADRRDKKSAFNYWVTNNISSSLKNLEDSFQELSSLYKS